MLCDSATEVFKQQEPHLTKLSPDRPQSGNLNYIFAGRSVLVVAWLIAMHEITESNPIGGSSCVYHRIHDDVHGESQKRGHIVFGNNSVTS